MTLLAKSPPPSDVLHHMHKRFISEINFTASLLAQTGVFQENQQAFGTRKFKPLAFLRKNCGFQYKPVALQGQQIFVFSGLEIIKLSPDMCIHLLLISLAMTGSIIDERSLFLQQIYSKHDVHCAQHIMKMQVIGCNFSLADSQMLNVY